MYAHVPMQAALSCEGTGLKSIIIGATIALTSFFIPSFTYSLVLMQLKVFPFYFCNIYIIVFQYLRNILFQYMMGKQRKVGYSLHVLRMIR